MEIFKNTLWFTQHRFLIVLKPHDMGQNIYYSNAINWEARKKIALSDLCVVQIKNEPLHFYVYKNRMYQISDNISMLDQIFESYSIEGLPALHDQKLIVSESDYTWLRMIV